jgi:hypothetical protein
MRQFHYDAEELQMYTIYYGLMSNMVVDEILEPSEIEDTKLRELLSQTNEFIAFRRGKNIYAVRRDKVKMISMSK